MFAKVIVALSALFVAVSGTTFAVVNSYSNSDCTGSVTDILTYSIGVCVSAYDSSDTTVHSLEWSYDSAVGVIGTTFSDASCQNVVSSWTIASGPATCDGFYSSSTTTTSYSLPTGYETSLFATSCQQSTPFSASSSVTAFMDDLFNYNCLVEDVYYYNSATSSYVYATNLYANECSGTSCTYNGGSLSVSICFAGEETVELQSGEKKRLADVELGDFVLASDLEGNTKFSEVIALPHPKNTDTATFQKVTTETGKDIQLTASHLISASAACDGKSELMQSADLAAGMCLRTTSGFEVITANEQVTGSGVYSVVTNEQLVVVNGFIASPFADNHLVGNAFYNIHRAIYQIAPAVLKSSFVTKVGEAFGAIVNMASGL